MTSSRTLQLGSCIVKAKGGMGNRLLCAASGILWSRAAGREPFVDWRDKAYSRSGENSFLHFFDNATVLREPPAETDDVHPPVWRGHLDMSVSEMFHAYDPDKHSSFTIHKKYSIDPSRAEYPQSLVVFWYYMGRFASIAPLARARLPGHAGLSVEEIARKALREELPLRQEIRERIERFARDHWAERVIGVHVRHTDQTTNLGKLERAAEAHRRRMPDAAIFLATDNRQVEESYRRKFGRVITTPKWFPPEGATMHQSEHCADPVENGVEALVDMYLLARCDALVYASRSTFSEISRLVSDIPPNRVTDIDRHNPKVVGLRLARRVIS